MSADNKEDKHVPTATIYISKAGRAESRYSHFDQNPHWWFDAKQSNSPSSNWSLGSSSFSSSPPPEPKSSTSLPATSGWNQWRRDSLKNMMCFDDFATPE